jgi:hypothetical protein
MKTATLSALLVLAMVVSAAAISENISYQGVLRDNVGNPVPDGSYDVTFKLHQTPVSPSWVWQETRTVTVEDGVFNAILGTTNSLLGVNFSLPYWLSISIEGEPELSPRTEVTSVPYAFEAAVAESARSGGYDSDWVISGDDIYHETGQVGIGVNTPSSRLDVDGTVKATGFQMATGASAGYVLTSDSSGGGSWQEVAATADGDWTVDSDDLYATVPGNVGIGTTAPAAKLDLATDASEEVLQVTQGGTYSRLCNIERTSVPGGNNDIVQIVAPSGSPDNFQFIECQLGTSIMAAIDGDGHINSQGGATLHDNLTVDADGEQAGSFTSDFSGGDAYILRSEYTGTDTGGNTAVAVYGNSNPATGAGAGGIFSGNYIGVRGVSEAIGSGSRYGVRADAYNGNDNYAVDAWAAGGTSSYGIHAETQGVGTGRAVRAYAHNSGTNYAISAWATGGTTNYAGYFTGNVHVNGTLSKTAGSFRIDHPLDPEGEYLQHSFVESPDMMNVYNGNVALDGSGEAWVELPDWFEALNRDFRYQLTCIGGFAPVYIAERIRDNRFKIGGGEPGMDVSWQVTGVRHDPYAEANRIRVEVPKGPNEVGKYVSPEVYGHPVEDGLGYVAPPARDLEFGLSASKAAAREMPSTVDE